MFSINESIFHAYDIRGIYPDEINEEVVFRIAAGLVKFLNPDKLVIAQDIRKSSDSLKDSVISAIISSGVDVIDIGSATTPLFYFAVNWLGAAGGIMITASHNPPNYNGLKLVREQAIVIGEQSGLMQIKKLSENIKIKGIRKGKIIEKNLEEEYEDFILKKSGLIKEPEIKDIKFEYDPDSDRLLVFENNKNVRADLLAGLVIKNFLSKPRSKVFDLLRGKPKFVYDLRFTKAIPEFIKENGAEAIRFRVGHVFIKEAMRENKALFGAELSGHFYFKDVFYVEAPDLMRLKILKIMQETGKLISELIQPFNKYFHSEEISIKINNIEQTKNIIQKIKENYKDGEIDEMDGITIDYPDPSTKLGTSWWFNLRSSNTEPMMRLVVEAKTQYIMEQKVEEITESIRQFSA